MLSTEDLAKRVYDSTFNSGGATLNVKGESPIDGYMVGGYVPTVIVPLSDFTADDVVSFIETHADVFDSDTSFYVGTWVSDGRVYIDASKRFAFLSDALIIGGHHGELAIWSVAHGKEIKL